MKLFRNALISAVVVLGVGCASLDADRVPAEFATGSEVFHVKKFGPDERRIDRVIADELSAMGLRASYGVDVPEAEEFDVLVTYSDRWQWDMTMYMRELNIQFREPGNRRMVARGRSQRDSLTRLPPDEMAREILHEMLGR